MRRPSRMLADVSGAAALEFALVVPALFALVLFLLIVGLIVYLNLSLDYATSKAARAVMIGSVQKAGLTQASFRTQYVCPYMPAAVSCNDVIVNLYILPESYGTGGYLSYVNTNSGTLNTPALSNSGASYALGAQGAYQYLEIVYPVTFIPNLLVQALGGATYNGNPAYLTVSTAAFKNEQF